MILELKNIDKSFGEKEVLKGVSFTAEGGKAFGLLGSNGAGKTTSIRILMNVFPANGGEVLIDGKPIDYDKIGIGYLPEERGLYPKKLIIDQLMYFAELKGLIFGHFTDCSGDEEDGTLDDCFADFLYETDFPCVKDFEFGHTPERYVLPLGAKAKFDADKACLEIVSY